MARVSSPEIHLLTTKATATSSAFERDYLYLVPYKRSWSSPIVGMGLRCGASAHGTVTLALVSDTDGQPDQVLFKTEMNLPHGKDSQGTSNVLASFDPVYMIESFWIGLRTSVQVEFPLRIGAFYGRKTTAPMDYAQITGSLLKTPTDLIVNDEKLGMPFLIPVFDESLMGGGQP
jgi:hypothetical protein